jgi:hypothetical protein
MATIPESQHTTATAIVKWYESQPQEHRPHMGASLIGHTCDRYIWMTWRWVMKPEFKGRILRLFDTGKREEPRLLDELRGIGAEVWDKDPAADEQWRVAACNGHFGGSLDGVARGLPEAPKTVAVLEFKTHSAKSWNEVNKKGVRLAKAQHFDQMTVYMKLMELDRALYVAVNKDTDEIYTEWVHLDEDRYKQLLNRAQRLIESTEPPYRISTDPEHFECKYCSLWKACHGGLAGEPNCRTCCHASPVENAAWQCVKHSKTLTHADQLAGCDVHLMIPALVPYADPIDGGDNYVVYKHKESGALFINGPDGCEDFGPVFSSKELHRCPGSLIGEVSEVKTEFPGSRVERGSVKAPQGSAFDDMESDDLDAVPTKREHPARKAARVKASATLKALEGLK